jgi:hypothetical protein
MTQPLSREIEIEPAVRDACDLGYLVTTGRRLVSIGTEASPAEMSKTFAVSIL